MFFIYYPRDLKSKWEKVHNCLVPDVGRDGIPHALNIYRLAPGDAEYLLKNHGIDTKACLLPGDVRLTNVHFFIVYSATSGSIAILLINVIYYMIYKLENPFLESFKIDPTSPWPW